MNTELSPIQKVLLETFKAFATICKENDIQYYAASGTLLGAIRHQGFIPWDDDIDVFLLRKDYDKLLSLKESLKPLGYKVADYHDQGYPYEFAKFFDSNKTFWEYKQFPFVMGPFIDLFPLDEFDDQNPALGKLYDDTHAAYWVYRKSISQQSWKEIWQDIVRFNGLEGPVKLVKKIFFAPQKDRYYKRIEKFDMQIRKVRGKYYKPYWDVKHIQYPKDWFDSAKEVPFEDTTIMIPNGYHELLTYIYHDYMTPPEKQERSGHHTAYYMNLERFVSIEEIRNEKKSDMIERLPLSISVLWDEIKHWKGFN